MRASVLLADCPWHYYGSPNKDQAAGKHYDLMSNEALEQLSLPISKVAENPSVLFMWTTCAKMQDAIDIMNSWGFFYRGVAFVWVKTRKDGGIISGQGVRPSFVKPTTEFVLVGSTQKAGRPLRLLDESIGQVILAPRGAHSEKPDEVRRRIDAMYGDEYTKLELFGRKQVDGWTVVGDAIDGKDIREALMEVANG